MRISFAVLALCCLVSGGCGEGQTDAPPGTDRDARGSHPPKETLERALRRANPYRGLPFSEIASATDAAQSREVWEFLSGAFEFQNKVYASPTRSATRIMVYGVIDRASQDRIVGLLTDQHSARGWKPILVRFLREERFTTFPHASGATVTKRLEEELLREVWVW